MDRARLFSVLCSDGTRGNGQKLEHGKSHTDTGKNFFTARVAELGQAAQRSGRLLLWRSPSLEVAETHRAQPAVGILLLPEGQDLISRGSPQARESHQTSIQNPTGRCTQTLAGPAQLCGRKRAFDVQRH